MTGHDREPPGGIGQTMIGDAAAKERLTRSIVDEADRVDEGKRFLESRLEYLQERATSAIERGEFAEAARAYDKIARVWRACAFAGQAEHFEARVRELRRRARKGKR